MLARYMKINGELSEWFTIDQDVRMCLPGSDEFTFVGFVCVGFSQIFILFFFSDEANNACSTVDLEEWRRPRSESSTGADNDSVYLHGSVCVDPNRRKRQVINFPISIFIKRRILLFDGFETIRLN